jgi:iron complex transport system substrate-binding protein
MRIVSLCPSNTEIVFAVGAGDQLVGCDRSSDFPSAVAALPRVGPDLEVDVDAVAALAPDLVLASLSVPGMERNVAALDTAGLRQIVVDAQSIEGVYAALRLVGRAVGMGRRAGEVVDEMRRRIDELAAVGRRLPPASVFLEWWPRPVIVPGRRCWTTEMIEIAGGRSAFADLDVRSTPIEEGRVIERDPDVLLTCWCGVPHERQRPDRLPDRTGWSSIRGVREGWIWAAEERYFGRPGPRVVEGIAWLQARLAERAAALEAGSR